ncbi:DUF2087 domain-containing protein [Streptomyces sp. NBC_00536]|uniref:DUF2087 domain-containing protein n=1 Tax=Streptomyces sp. NBC_00536 TaxID=2975769 RepID=UPI002E817EBF|nr:DUF2087 domain-containing protein [Streptomyces sp. NBC_00536]WUC82556.1 DUF2087 domain-containing protein [Streptomyces sp. NBC_00536]
MSENAPQHPPRTQTAPEQTRAERRGVADLFSPTGRLKAVPRKPARREQLLRHLAETLFDPDRAYTEPEVNEALRSVHDDSAALRRYLVIAGHLTRTRDGGSYQRGTAAA